MNEKILEVAEEGVYLSLERGFLKAARKNGEEYKIPIDEIGGVIANSFGLTYSNNLLVRLSELNVPLVVCGRNHSPAGVLWPVDPHHNTSGRIDYQLRAKAPLYKRLWQAVVRVKIANQAAVLKALGKNYIKIESLIKRVTSGDGTNVEGFAARLYWQELLGDRFIRNKKGDGVNAMLNYGYAIIRSGVARSVMGAGLHPAIGIFHKNKSDPMRLVDDLMEPFRPLTDYKVFKLAEIGETQVSPKVKKELAEILYLDMDSPKGRSPVINRMQSLATSFAASLETLKISLDLPILNERDLTENE